MSSTQLLPTGAEQPFDWDTDYVVSRAITFQVAPDGNVLATGSILRPHLTLTWESVQFLGLFALPRSIRDVFVEASASGCTEADFRHAIAVLIDANLILNRSTAQALPSMGQFASARDHHTMLRDVPRVMAYKTAIDRHVAGKSVVDLGTGTGILATFAAKAGASRVDAIEESPIGDVASEMFRANGCSHRITLHSANSKDVVLRDPADVLVHEIIGRDPLDENVVSYIADAKRRLLRPGGRMIPCRLEICCHAFEVTDQPYSDKDLFLRQAAELGGLYGLDLAPFRDALSALPASAFEHPIDVGNIATFHPRLLSGECQLRDIDFETDDDGKLDESVLCRVTMSEEGVLGGLLLHFRAHLDDTTAISNSPFAPPTGWRRGVKSLPRMPVRPGDSVTVKVGVRSVLGRQRLAVDLWEAGEERRT